MGNMTEPRERTRPTILLCGWATIFAPLVAATLVLSTAVPAFADATVSTVQVGKSPWGVAVTPDGQHVYVVNPQSGTVSVVDTAANTVGSTISVGDGVPYSVAINPAGTRAYVANSYSQDISVIDTSTNAVTATIPVVGGLDEDVLSGADIAINPDGTRAYVTLAGQDNVFVVDLVANILLHTVPLGVGPSGVAVSPDGTHFYVASADHVAALDSSQTGIVSIIDSASDTVTGKISVGTNLNALAINPAGTRLYAVGQGIGKGQLSVIDINTKAVVSNIAMGGTPAGVAVNSAGTRVYATSFDDGDMTVVDPATNTIVGTVPSGASSVDLAINPDGTRAYVANNLGDNPDKVPPGTLTVLSIEAPAAPTPADTGSGSSGLPLWLLALAIITVIGAIALVVFLLVRHRTRPLSESDDRAMPPTQAPAPDQNHPIFATAPSTVSDHAFCGSCGAALDQDARFCAHCGAEVKGKGGS